MSDDDDKDTDRKMPRGLQVNPALRVATAKQFERVDRAIERQTIRRRLRSDGDDRFEPYPRQQVHQSAKKLSAREELKERERLLKKEMRRAVPSMHALMARLDQKELLPAIFFIFSRAGCDEAANLVYRYMKGPRDSNLAFPHEFLEGFAGKRAQNESKKRTSQQRANRRRGLVRDSDGRSFRTGSNFVSDDLFLSSLYEAPDQLLSEADFDENGIPLAAEDWEYYSKAGLLNF